MSQHTLCCQTTGLRLYRPIASPSYIEKFGAPKKPEELVKHRCIYSPLGSSSQRNEWVINNGARREKVPLKVQWKLSHKGLALSNFLEAKLKTIVKIGSK